VAGVVLVVAECLLPAAGAAPVGAALVLEGRIGLCSPAGAAPPFTLGGVARKRRDRVVAVRLDDEQGAWLDEQVARWNAEHPDGEVTASDWLRWMLDVWRRPAREPDRRRMMGTG
jgi:hypothetical protein